MKPHCHRLNPNTGTISFGTVPKLKIPNWSGMADVEAKIHLFWGWHKRTKKGFVTGFGVKHILAEHKKDIQDAGFTRAEEYVASIVCKGTPLYYEGGFWKRLRILAVSHGNGMAVLEYMEHHGHWSIVTAYGRKWSTGHRVGTIS